MNPGNPRLSRSGRTFPIQLRELLVLLFKAVSQLLWPDRNREVWFSLRENDVKAGSFDLHQLRNCFSRRARRAASGRVVLRRAYEHVLVMAVLEGARPVQRAYYQAYVDALNILGAPGPR